MSTSKNQSPAVDQIDSAKPGTSPEVSDKEQGDKDQLDDERLDSVAGGLGSVPGVTGGQLDYGK